MKTIFLVAMIAVSLSSCVSTGMLFQDGKTLGKDTTELSGSISINQIPNYSNSDSTKLEIKDSRVPMPWLQFNIQHGVGKKFDIGGGFGLGAKAQGFQAFVKYELLPKESRAGIALFALGTISMANVDEQEDDLARSKVFYSCTQYAVPISFQASKRVALVLQPIYAWERLAIKAKTPDGNPETPDRIVMKYESYRLGAGVVVRTRRNARIHYNVTTAYYPSTKSIAPTFGIAISQAW